MGSFPDLLRLSADWKAARHGPVWSWPEPLLDWGAVDLEELAMAPRLERH
jgi:hypothetical protein